MVVFSSGMHVNDPRLLIVGHPAVHVCHPTLSVRGGWTEASLPLTSASASKPTTTSTTTSKATSAATSKATSTTHVPIVRILQCAPVTDLALAG